MSGHSKKKRFFLSVVEEIIQNPDYFGFRGGRIEVFDEKNKGGYQSWEIRFFVPEKIYGKFHEMFDGLELTEWEFENFGLNFNGREILGELSKK